MYRTGCIENKRVHRERCNYRAHATLFYVRTHNILVTRAFERFVQINFTQVKPITTPKTTAAAPRVARVGRYMNTFCFDFLLIQLQYPTTMSAVQASSAPRPAATCRADSCSAPKRTSTSTSIAPAVPVRCCCCRMDAAAPAEFVCP